MKIMRLHSRDADRTATVAIGLGLLIVLLQQPLARAQNNGGPVSQTSYGFVLGEAGGPGDQHIDNGTTSAISKSYDMNGAEGYASAAIGSDDSGLFHPPPNLHAVANAAAGSPLGAYGQAQFSDTIAVESINNFNPNFTSLTLRFIVDGSLSGNANGTLNVQWGDASVGFSLGNGVQTFEMPVSVSDLSAQGGSGSFFSASFTETLTAAVNNSAGAASADFGDTVRLGEVDAYDANGNQVAAQLFDIYNDGTPGPLSFPANTNLVPEPSTWALLGLGSAGLFGLALRRRAGVHA